MIELRPRWQKRVIERELQTSRVLLLAGPRQCGKTTLARQLVGDDIAYRTLDDLTFRQAARNDPHDFVRHDKKTLIIDEVQQVPELMPAIKKEVDENTRPGQYLLTGSADIRSLSRARESLAGRISRLRLRPLSQGELQRKQPDFLAAAFARKFPSTPTRFDKDNLLDAAFRGGFPEAIGRGDRARRRWHRQYIEALVERDLADISRIRRVDAMRQLVRIMAAWSAKYMDISAIGAGLSIRRPTLEAYINALEALYLVERVNPWTKTDYGRVGKQRKTFMSDCGLMASILGWQIEQVRFDVDRSGKLTETFAFNEIAAQIDAADDGYELFHYRDRLNREIDFLVEREDGALLGVEIKSGTSVRKRDFTHLAWFRDNLALGRAFVGIVLYPGEKSVSFGGNLWAVPFGALWP